jgi:hypothetical protein
MSDEESMAGTTCRLIRRDGSEWIVTRFDLREGGAWITARRVGDPVGAERTPNGASTAKEPATNGVAGVNGASGVNGAPSPNGASSGHGHLNGHAAERLQEAPLEHGDRLVWTRRDGTIAWAMRNPTGVGLEWAHSGRRDADFFAGDFR